MLGELEQGVLIAILRLGDEAYGAPIRRLIETDTRRRVGSASVYKTLTRLEAKGLVSSREGPPTPRRGGRHTRRYALTIAGRSTLAVWHAGLRRLARGLDLD